VGVASRSPALPDVPTISELPGYEASAVHGVGAPRTTPVEIIEKLNRVIDAVLAEPAIKARFVDKGATLLVAPPPTSAR
jgi:tripartite-type tricarboxylate transporter receptor subunit TctC